MINKKILIRIILGIVILGVITLFLPQIGKIFRPSARKVLGEAGEEFDKLNTFSFNFSFERETKFNQSPESSKASIILDGEIDNKVSPQTKFQGKSFLENISGGNKFQLAWEEIIIGEDSWFKLTDLPFPRFPEIFSLDLEKMQNQWIKPGRDNFEDLFGKFSPRAKIEVIKKLISNDKIFQLKKGLPDEVIEGNQTFHYLFILEEDELKKLLPEISELLPVELKELEKIKNIKVEIWIGKKDKLIYKAKIEGDTDLKEVEPNLEGKMVIKANISLSKFNLPIKIEAPSEFKSLEEIYGAKDFKSFFHSE